MIKPKVVVQGDFIAPGSLAIVNRGWFEQLARRGRVELAIRAEPTARRIPGSAGDLLEPLRSVAFERADVTVRHLWPPGTASVPGGAYAHVQPWEFGALPKGWVAAWRDAADEIWCYSAFVAREYVEAGFAPERVHVVPAGFDPEIFCPRESAPLIETGRRCVFLFVGATIRRKGIDVLVNAFLNGFKPADDVALVIKDVDPDGLYRLQSMREQIRGLCANPGLAKMIYTDRSFAEAGGIADLYRGATCLVHPYRGEGFGLPVLEAMACGIPVIVTRGGATDDFVTPDAGYLIDAGRVAAGFVSEDECVAEPWLLEPDVHQLIEAMRQVYEHPDGARDRGRKGAERARAGWTWEHAAEKLEARILHLAERASERPQAATPAPAIGVFESKVASQNGEDGVLVELFRRLGPAQPFFVEFGVEDGLECNSRYLALNFGWSGVLIEGDPVQFARLRENYRTVPGVKAIEGYITRENACNVFEEAGVPPEFALLSIDIDGNDYWVWEALGERFRPQVIVIETNGAYPPPRRWVMAYDPAHTWQHDTYYGASLESLHGLGDRLGYALVGMESAGVNAFFVRRDLLGACGFRELSAAEAFRPPKYRHRERTGPAVEI